MIPSHVYPTPELPNDTLTIMVRFPTRDAICNVCQKVMNEWHGTVGRAYTLKSQAANAGHH